MSAADRQRRVDDVCHAALERDAAERSAFVSAACGSDEALRQEVEALLAHAQTAEGFLGESVGAVAADVLGESEARRAGPSGSAGDLIGRRLGPYAIVARLGAGGMGEVYRARDAQLGRDVAIKVLPAAFVTDRERLARFEREARLLAALNHPHIGAIYGLENVDGVRALVLELVEGETLADRIARRPMSVADALPVARQIADALEAAHEKGIVHRDLKPANIKITPAGVVKVLDFGLAKAGEGGRPDLSHSPPVTISGTHEGVLLGTVAYMSPEQARGQVVDKRTDIWAFGCVLYEMLLGRAAFSGETVSDYIVAILDCEPSWTALPAATPPGIHRLLHRCLDKDSRRRLHDIADARIEIEETLASPSSSVENQPHPRRLFARMAPWAAGILIGAIAVAVLDRSFMPRRTDSRTAMIRSVIPLPTGLRTVDDTALAISPDGTQVVYLSDVGGHSQLFLRALDRSLAEPLPGTEGGSRPFFSPDGKWVGFSANRKLMKIAISGGAPQVLCDALGFRGAAWGEDGTIVFATFRSLSRVSANGGSPHDLITHWRRMARK